MSRLTQDSRAPMSFNLSWNSDSIRLIRWESVDSGQLKISGPHHQT